MKIFLKEDYYLEIDEALFKTPNLIRHTTGARSHILLPGEEFDAHDPKFDSSMSPEEYAEQARILSELPVGTHKDNSDPSNLKDNVFGWVIKNNQSEKGRNIKIKIPTQPTSYNPRMFPELVMYSQDGEIISYMLLQGKWKLNRYNRDFDSELDESIILDEDEDVVIKKDVGDQEVAVDIFNNSADTTSAPISENLSTATPYLLRTDGKLIECEFVHPYVILPGETFRQSVDRILKDRYNLRMFYDNSSVEQTKSLIEGFIAYLEKLEYKLPTEFEEIKDTEVEIINPTINEAEDILTVINDATNQEFCRVRTSDMLFGGHNNDIYIRISSVGFNWFDTIWKFVMENAEFITTVTVGRDDTLKEYKINGKPINHIETQEFLTLPGNPILEHRIYSNTILNETYDNVSVGKSLLESFGILPMHRIHSIVNVFKDNDSYSFKTINLTESIETHNELNPALWENEELLPEVKEGIEKIVSQFIEELKENDVELKVLDTILVGSNASYNYTKNSDLDVHIVADTSIIPCEYGLLPIIYNMARSQFNNKYDVSIHGVPIELYVEDMKTSANSNGIYSLKNGWVKKPIRLDIPEVDISDIYPEWEERAENLIKKVEDYIV